MEKIGNVQPIKKTLLLVIGWPLRQGGHIGSALGLGGELVKRGWQVVTLAPDGERRVEYEAVGMTVIPARLSLFGQLGQLLRLFWCLQPDVILAMDYVALLRVAILRCIVCRKTIFVKAGGKLPPYYFPPVEVGVVFSKELMDGFVTRMFSSQSKMVLLQERIDRIFFSSYPYPKSREILACVICMRLTSSKKQWLDNLFQALDKVADRLSFDIKVIGGGAQEAFYRSWGERINRIAGRTAVMFYGEINDHKQIRDYYRQADVVVGHGRGILEAMSCGRPAIILSTSGGAEWVTEANCRLIETYNFSGRHMPSGGGRPVTELLADAPYPMRKCLGEWSACYVADRYDLVRGGEKMNKLCVEQHPLRSRLDFVAWLLRGRQVWNGRT